MIERLIHDLLKEIGEDPTREGLEKTPARVAKAWEYLTSGYKQDVHAVLNEALFTEEYDEMVVVKDIDFYSLCEHHLLPFVRQVPHRVHAVAQDRRALEAAAPGGDVRAPAAGAGAAHHPDRADAQRGAAAARASRW